MKETKKDSVENWLKRVERAQRGDTKDNTYKEQVQELEDLIEKSASPTPHN